jgi:predicted type IV restriction endonuclease
MQNNELAQNNELTQGNDVVQPGVKGQGFGQAAMKKLLEMGINPASLQIATDGDTYVIVDESGEGLVKFQSKEQAEQFLNELKTLMEDKDAYTQGLF